MRRLAFLMFFLIFPESYAFNWQDLWTTKNQQATAMMKKGQYKEASKTFSEEAWQAAAAFRAGDYKGAHAVYSRLQTSDAYYNQGNADAYLGQYEQAIAAYNKALAIDRNMPDALHNRQIVEALLKKKKDNTSKEPNQQKKPNNNQSEQKQKSSSEDQDKQNKPPESKQDQSDSKTNKPKNEGNDPSNQTNNPKQAKEPKSDKPYHGDETPKEKASNPPKDSKATEAEQQMKDQWLRLIPDDPGGLLREKFLRDYLSRQGRT